ncbi:MAG: creatininase family protein [Burkholderiales bacterium]
MLATAGALAGVVPPTAFAASASRAASDGTSSNATIAAPATLNSDWLEDLTSTELQDRIRAGTTTLLVPIGGVEQSGPGIALGKHNQRVRVLVQRIAEALGNAVIAPVVAYVPEGNLAPPTSHMRFTGTISVPDDVFVKTLIAAAESLQVHGIKDVVFLGDHGGYQKLLEQATVQLNRRWAGKAHAFAPPAYYRASSEGFATWLRGKGYASDEIGQHAGLADASLQLAVAPQSVRLQRLQNGAPPGLADGVQGNARRASAQLGQAGVEVVVRETVAAIRQAVASER